MLTRNAGCTACPLHMYAKTVCVPGDGPKRPDILVIGQNPGQQEDRQGRPFIGPSGKILKRQLEKAALIPDVTVRFTNIVRCVTPNNREPSAKEIKACKPYLDAEIAACKPKYIVPLGAPATKALAKTKITQSHGQMIERDGRVIMPTYHPAATFRDPSKLTVIGQDFARLRRQIDGTLGATQDAFKHRVVRNEADLMDFWHTLEQAEEYAYDTETNGLILAKRDFLVRCISIAFPEQSWVIPLEMPHSKYAGDAHAQAAFFRVLKRKSAGKWVYTFHGKYDSGAIRQAYKVSLPYHFDGMLAHYLFDENQDHDLKYVARIELDCEEYDIPKELKLSDTPKWLELIEVLENRETYWRYNARDAWNTLYWGRKALARLRRNTPLRRLYYALSMPSSYALEAIEREGLPLDLQHYTEVEARIELEREAQRRQLNKTAGREINWNSNDQIAAVLFNDLKLPVKLLTDGGKPSTSEEAIVDLKGQHSIINELLKYRELDKILGTYLKGWKKKGYVIDKRLYLSYKQTGTVTGRFSSRLHQIPTDSDIRSIISAVDLKEWDFVQADLSQAELRIAAEMSGDPTLIRIYREGGDVHWNTVLFLVGAGHMPEYTTAAIDTAKALNICRRGQDRITLTDALEVLRIAGVEACTKVWKEWKTARTNAKRIAFGFLYGMYENTFIEKAKVDYDWMCTYKQAHAFRTGFFEVYSGLPDWHTRCKRIARIDGYVTNFFGRVRRLPALFSSDKSARAEAERQAVNAPVQGTIGDWKAAAMVEIHETIDPDKYKLCGEHHDALLGLARRGCEDEVLPQVRQIMQRPRLLKTFKINMRVPMAVDISVGPWGAGKAYRDARIAN